jgi:hypothetical protein
MHRGLWAAPLLLLSTAAHAEDSDDAAKWFFFSNPRVTRDQAAADWDECRDLASQVRPPQGPYVYAPGAAGAAAAGFMKGLIEGAQRRHMSDAALRKCLNIKGYQRYAMSKAESEALYGGEWAQMRERLVDRALAPVGAAERLEP